MKKYFIINNHPEATEEAPVFFRGTAKAAMSLVSSLNKAGAKTSLKACKKASEKRAAQLALAA